MIKMGVSGDYCLICGGPLMVCPSVNKQTNSEHLDKQLKWLEKNYAIISATNKLPNLSIRHEVGVVDCGKCRNELYKFNITPGNWEYNREEKYPAIVSRSSNKSSNMKWNLRMWTLKTWMIFCAC